MKLFVQHSTRNQWTILEAVVLFSKRPSRTHQKYANSHPSQFSPFHALLGAITIWKDCRKQRQNGGEEVIEKTKTMDSSDRWNEICLFCCLSFLRWFLSLGFCSALSLLHGYCSLDCFVCFCSCFSLTCCLLLSLPSIICSFFNFFYFLFVLPCLSVYSSPIFALLFFFSLCPLFLFHFVPKILPFICFQATFVVSSISILTSLALHFFVSLPICCSLGFVFFSALSFTHSHPSNRQINKFHSAPSCSASFSFLSSACIHSFIHSFTQKNKEQTQKTQDTCHVMDIELKSSQQAAMGCREITEWLVRWDWWTTKKHRVRWWPIFLFTVVLHLLWCVFGNMNLISNFQ